MAEKNDEAKAEEINISDTASKIEESENSTQGDSINVDKCEENDVQEEEVINKKKYGGLLPKKHPLISKDNERAFFDSADWALGKVGVPKSRPLEALSPKLQPTRHEQTRTRSAYARAGDDDLSSDICSSDNLNQGEGEGTLDGNDDDSGEIIIPKTD